MSLNQVLGMAYPYLFLFILAFVCAIILVILYFYFFIYKRRRRWKVEVHEQKADGKLHTVGRDKLIEKRKQFGKITYYWMKLARQEAIPPPSEVVDRFGRKEEVDYLRIERDFVPAQKKLLVDVNKVENRRILIKYYDAIIKKIHSVKTTIWSSDAVKDRFIYIPVQKTLTAKIEYSPIPYDMNMMAVNEITNADAHFNSQYEWWKKYGAVLVFGATVVFLLIIAVLTYQHLENMAQIIVNKLSDTNSILQSLGDKLAGTGKPPA